MYYYFYCCVVIIIVIIIIIIIIIIISGVNPLVPELFGRARAEKSNRRARNRVLPFYFYNSMLAGKTP